NNNGAQTAVLTGAPTSGDQGTITVVDAGLAGGQQSVTYTVQSGDTLSSIALGLANAINANPALVGIGVTASAVATVITITSRSTHATTYSQSTSVGATETITLGKTVGITRATFNKVNALTGLDPGGVMGLQGTTNKAVKSVTINGAPATLNWSRS